jgi:hypothetical protein
MVCGAFNFCPEPHNNEKSALKIGATALHTTLRTLASLVKGVVKESGATAVAR